MVTLTPSLLSVFVASLYTFVVVSCQFTTFSQIDLPPRAVGPTSAAFSGLVLTEGPFTTVRDGRILKWLGPDLGFVDFAYTTPTRTKQLCDGTTDPNNWPICGRPTALSFNPITGLLYITDAYFGLLVVGPNDGLATQLAGGFKFAFGIDVDMLTSIVYFCDASLTYNIR
ncbi:strictosidine synthase-like [Bidens hawaiensis]|uniref:strictosidine synthase-like n=1 Tax=Bidens hawaiensis TaxID=980011 RepID=UPI00404B4EAA